MYNQTLIRESRPPYWVGLFCLIPLLGAFVGAGMILAGLIRYKDKWFTALGIGGIAFTVIIYGSMFYALKNSSSVQEGFEGISRMQLNSLVPDIEFYKLQHGKYPDRLEQLTEFDKLAPINDAVQSIKIRESTLYNYENLGEKYTLYSSGADGIQNTKDDFYPSISIFDSSKIGLIKR